MTGVFSLNPITGRLDEIGNGGGSGGGDLLAINNLSDVQSIAQSRINLGLEVGVDVQAFDADLQAIASLAGIAGVLCKTNANSWALRILTAGTAISISHPTGSATNPTIGVTGGGLAWSVITGPSTTMAPNTGYFTDNAATVNMRLPIPATNVTGNCVEVIAKTMTGWRITQNATQQIRVGNQLTTFGGSGYIESTDIGDSVSMRLDDTGLWYVVASIGTLTVV